jgi:serine/threonine-protein kinase
MIRLELLLNFSLRDAVITELARIRSLVVRPSSVMSKYQGQARIRRTSAVELNVDAVLSPDSFMRESVSAFNAQLLDVRSNEIIWSDRIDASSDDVIGVQDEITQRIVDGLRLELSPDEQAGCAIRRPSTPKRTKNTCAAATDLRDSSFARCQRKIAMAAIQHFNRAIELRSRIRLWRTDGLGACHVNRVFKGWGVSKTLKSRGRFHKACQSIPTIIEARMLMVFVLFGAARNRRHAMKWRACVAKLPTEAVVYFVKARCIDWMVNMTARFVRMTGWCISIRQLS